MKLGWLTFGLLLAIMTIEMSVFIEMTVSRSESEEAMSGELVLEDGDGGKLSSNVTEMSRRMLASNLAKKKKTTKKTTKRSRNQTTTQEDTTFYVSQNILTTTPDPFSGLIFDWTINYSQGQTRSTDVVDQQYSKCPQVSSVFAMVALIEGAYAALMNKAVVALSKQQALDCFASFTCDKYVPLKTVVTTLVNVKFYSQTDYPYTGVKGQCQTPAGATHAGFIDLVYPYTTETDLIDGLKKYDPAATELNDVKIITSYKNGVWTCTPTAEKFSAVITGYGVHKGVNYWRLKGSFGKNWGENGYFRVVRGNGDPCGILSYVAN